ncbi:MAG: RnfABCDGE type electron transport complex subunit B [Candidatus Omnitrophica bacterium]|nr:RnfABCDGE type electron transport complex subunit B [Candidatus Omnitrophota bacterium]
MLLNILIPVATMTALGLIFGVGLAYALKIFGIKTDPMVFMLLSKLPGANCGACGRAGCQGFAEALKSGEAIPSGCVVSNDEARRSVAELLGMDYEAKAKSIATLLCNGGKAAKDKYIYKGIETCKADSLVFGGHKACLFGCLGHGDCASVCPFDAITMGADGLPVVNPARCTACGNCVKACPKSLFTLAPPEKRYYVKCNSTDPGPVVARVCKNGCIACGRCEKVCPTKAAKVENNLARINCDKCENIGKCFEVCPTKVIVRRAEGYPFFVMRQDTVKKEVVSGKGSA